MTSRSDADLAVPFDVHAAVLAAAARLQGRLVETPLVPSPWLSQRTGAEVRWKLENVQRTGSFKARGALHKLLQLGERGRAAGVVAASSGNHGLGLADAGAQLGCAVEVFVPTTTPAAKRDAIAALGAVVRVHGDDCVDTEQHARAVASATGRPYVSPYNAPDVIAGQGTVAHELLRQWPDVQRVYVAVGGGGLIGGMAGYGRVAAPSVQWIGCSPAASPAMERCVQQRAVVDVPCGDTLSDSTHGGVEPGSVTLPLCQRFVDRWLQVDEAAIARFVLESLRQQHLLVEGAAAVALAACAADPLPPGARAAVVVCGANMPFDVLRRLVAHER